MRRNRRKKIAIGIVTAVLLVAVGIAIGWVSAGRLGTNSTYSLLDPGLKDKAAQKNLINFDPVRQQVKQYLKSLDTSYAFYFEYLPTGANIRVDEDQVSVAASLMKIPVVMDLYKLAEQGSVNLDDTVSIMPEDINGDADYGDPSGLSAGATISLRSAAKLALHDSDNTSIKIIKRVITPLATNDSDAIASLDIPYTLSGNDPNNKTLLIGARSYGSILKCLYYACFLQLKDSQEILGYLIGSRDLSRLASGLPSNVPIAHKIGSGIKAQSDCGIVYQPQKPYLICMMFWDYPETSGNDTDAYFKKVSQMISDYVTKAGN